MRWIKYPLAIAGATGGITLGLATLRPMLAVAPNLTEAHPLLTELNRVNSLMGLYQLRDRIQSDLETLPQTAQAQGDSRLDIYYTLTQLTEKVSQRIQGEQQSEAAFKRATELAIQAMATRESGEKSLQALQQEEFLWNAAIKQLQTIPENALQAQQAQEKIEQYSRIVEPVAKQVDQAQSVFLKDIAEATGQSTAIRISLCHLSGECRNYQGDVPPASPASLIKLPMAVALMHKVTAESIDLNQKIRIDSHNYTENADGAKIFVDHEYPLGEVMARMINESNNIATNQLIDYLGWDYINTTLKELGFPQTTVSTKLVGESTYPTKNMGSAPNATTVNELTEMMRQIYTFQHPGDETILDALVEQTDWEFGHKALKDLDRKRVSWIGEKTGQNSKVIGSTLAVKVDEERYVLTVTIDQSANQLMLRQIIRDVVQHLLDNGHLVETPR
ncbi:MAG TPA: serine hydrolase [Trichocoleus sp.]